MVGFGVDAPGTDDLEIQGHSRLEWLSHALRRYLWGNYLVCWPYFIEHWF